MNLAGGRSANVAQELFGAIVDGRYPEGAKLPTEPVLCAKVGVSRVTLREAVKSLQQRGVLSVEQGRGTFVNPAKRWSPFDPVLLAARTASGGGVDPEWAKKLLEVRRMLEVGVAGLAAERRSDDDIAIMDRHLDAMRNAHRAGDIRSFAEADLAFHDAVMAAAGNELLAALFDPISRLVNQSRLATSRTADRQAHALRAHRSIHRAVVARDGPSASAAMRRHLDNTFVFVATGISPEEIDREAVVPEAGA